jgi:hypothetical protein
MIEGQTNVRSSRCGAGALDGIGKELGRFIVTTMDVPWRLAQPRLGVQPIAVLHVEDLEIETLDRQAAAAPECDTVLALGGGQAIDLGKYLAWKRGRRLVTAPNRHADAVAFMDAVGLRYQPADLGIRREDLAASMLNLRRYDQDRRGLLVHGHH